MKRKTILITVLVLSVLIFVQTGCQSSKKDISVQSTPQEPREVWHLVTVTATVEAIDVANREVTLKGPQGGVISFTVDERVKRLNEITVGDEVTADYYVSLAWEIREPTEEEKAEPLTVVAGAAKAPPDTSPGAGGLRQIKAVVTVEGIDRSAETVWLKGPLGNYLTVEVADPARLETVRAGDTVVVTYTEALAISVEKVE